MNMLSSPTQLLNRYHKGQLFPSAHMQEFKSIYKQDFCQLSKPRFEASPKSQLMQRP